MLRHHICRLGSFLVLVVALAFVATGCSGSKKELKKEGPSVEAPVVDLNAISSSNCVFYDRNRVESYIKMADPECLKKALEDGISGNDTHIDSFFGTKKILLELALEDSALFFAKNNKFGAASVIALLLNNGGDANRKFEDGTTLLERALRISAGSEPVTLYVLHFAATNVNLPSRGGMPLEVALDVKRENLVKALITRSADVNQFKNGTALTHVALESGLMTSARDLVNAGADVNAKNVQGSSLLQRTVSKEQRDFFDLLLSKRAVINTKSDAGETPLMTAVTANDNYFFNRLLNSGADINAIDSDGRSALFRAVSQNRIDRADPLLRKNAKVDGTNTSEGNTLLHVASDLRLAQELVRRGVPVDRRNDAKETALSLSVGSNRASFVSYYLSQGADSKWVDRNGRSLLHLAVSNNSIETANILFGAGLSVSVEDDSGQKPIFEVVSVPMFNLLIKQGATVETTNKTHIHPFTKVLQRLPSERSLLSAFIDKGARPDADVFQGFFPLQYVVSYLVSVDDTEKASLLAFLMKSGANPDLRDSRGNAAIHYVRSLELLTALHTGGANLSAKDLRGNTLRHTVDTEASELERRLENIKKSGTEKEYSAAELRFKPSIAKLRGLETFLRDKGALAF